MQINPLKSTSPWKWPWFYIDIYFILTSIWPWHVALTLIMNFNHIQRNKKLKYVNFAYELDNDPMTFILKLDLDRVKTYLHTKNEVCMWRFKKLWPEQTDRYKTYVDLA